MTNLFTHFRNIAESTNAQLRNGIANSGPMLTTSVVSWLDIYAGGLVFLQLRRDCARVLADQMSAIKDRYDNMQAAEFAARAEVVEQAQRIASSLSEGALTQAMADHLDLSVDAVMHNAVAQLRARALRQWHTELTRIIAKWDPQN